MVLAFLNPLHWKVSTYYCILGEERVQARKVTILVVLFEVRARVQEGDPGQF